MASSFLGAHHCMASMKIALVHLAIMWNLNWEKFSSAIFTKFTNSRLVRLCIQIRLPYARRSRFTWTPHSPSSPNDVSTFRLTARRTFADVASTHSQHNRYSRLRHFVCVRSFKFLDAVILFPNVCWTYSLLLALSVRRARSGVFDRKRIKFKSTTGTSDTFVSNFYSEHRFCRPHFLDWTRLRRSTSPIIFQIDIYALRLDC